jgi:uncharacterized protein YjdB
MKVHPYLKVLFISLFIFNLASCSDEDISLSDYEVTLKVSETITIEVEKDNGGCSIESRDENIARASIDGNTVTIYGIATGTTSIIFTDRISKTASVQVTVTD